MFCECRNFRAVHIFALFAFPKYVKYVYRENNLYYAIYRQYPLGIFGCFDVRVTSDSDVGSWLDFG